ncbi:hypothetical protein OIA_05100 [Enterococcus faecium EnGen0018]|nr:hypothetical protein OIA_05100 [Enterococcus faecium EnGen0018]
MKLLTKFFTLTCFLFPLALLPSSLAFAEQEVSAGGFTIEGVPHDKQLDPDVGYFYLKEEVGAVDSVKVKLINSSDQDKTLTVELTNANTNASGIIDYSGVLEDHSSLKTPLTSIAKVSEKEVLVPKDSSVETEISINMPKQSLSGVVVGGIVVSEKQDEKKKAGIANTYNYTLGLVLTNESKVELNKNVSVQLERVGASLVNGRKMVQADILNPNPYIFSKAVVKGKILEKDSGDLVKEQELNQVSIAPYSVFPFQFDWKRENLKPGTYLFTGSVTANGKTWDFEKEFAITAEKAKKLNEEAAYKIYVPKWLSYSLYFLGSLTSAGTLYLVVRNRKRKAV